MKTRDSCNPEIAIEPSALENTSGNATEKVDDSDMEFEDTATKGSDEHEGKDNLFIPIKRDKRKKKEDVIVEALQVLNKVVERDHTNEVLDLMKDQMQKAQEHELKVLKMIFSLYHNQEMSILMELILCINSHTCQRIPTGIQDLHFNPFFNPLPIIDDHFQF